MTIRDTMDKPGITRRSLGQFLASLGTASLLTGCESWPQPAPLPTTPAKPGEDFWVRVREQFLMPERLAAMNAANLCPSSLPVIEALYANTKYIDADPSFQNRGTLRDAKNHTRELLASNLGVTQDEIVLVRNTSEANNMVSSGLDLGPGDEVLLFADNHPSNNAAWHIKAERHGFTVRSVDAINPAPGGEAYLDAFAEALTSRTKILAFTHVTNTIGELFPAKQLCAMARERGVLTLIDGAQTFGVLDLDLHDIGADFFTGSGHKWPCGPKEVGLFYIAREAQEKLWPSVISIGGGTGAAGKFERLGQRDDAAIIAFGEALEFQRKIGLSTIEARSRELAQLLKQGLQAIPGVELWTPSSARDSAAVVSFRPGAVDGRKLFAALYQDHGIIGAPRGGDRPGMRLAPHFYNLRSEVERAVEAIDRYVRSGA